MHAHLRIARPVSNLARTERMYRDALELSVLARFEDHDGFSGVMLGRDGLDYHFEFTHCPDHPIAPSPTPEDLIVFYLPDRPEWEAACARDGTWLHAGDVVQSVLGNIRPDLRGCRRLPDRAAERHMALTGEHA
ncbi:hypothetical protein QZM35_08000 [Burkholderia sp. AU45274]|nr:hypothetical protein [Burkholderia sp. AU45274]MDN7487642.1 hypothetical protein [Burkholderia sp. AU45274]